MAAAFRIERNATPDLRERLAPEAPRNGRVASLRGVAVRVSGPCRHSPKTELFERLTRPESACGRLVPNAVRY